MQLAFEPQCWQMSSAPCASLDSKSSGATRRSRARAAPVPVCTAGLLGLSPALPFISKRCGGRGQRADHMRALVFSFATSAACGGWGEGGLSRARHVGGVHLICLGCLECGTLAWWLTALLSRAVG
jgi:hypothetical protein